MNRALTAVDRWFTGPAPAERLAVFRILLGLFTVTYLVVRLPVFWSLADGRSSRFLPVGVLSPLTGPVPGPVVQALVIIAVIAAIGFTVGGRFRLTGSTLALCMLLLGTYRNSWGQLLHFENLMVLHLLVVGMSPAADAHSLDARRRRVGAGPSPSAAYGWPLRLSALIMVITYVLAGVAKLRYGGIDWMLGDTLQNHVAYSAARLELLGGTPAPLAGPLVDRAWLFPPLAAATVVLELAAPVALLRSRLRTWWVVGAWLMHAGIVALMFIVFPYPLFGVAFAPLYALERLPGAVRARVAGKRISEATTAL